MKIKIGGGYKDASCYVKVSGVYKACQPYLKVGGEYRQVADIVPTDCVVITDSITLTQELSSSCLTYAGGDDITITIPYTLATSVIDLTVQNTGTGSVTIIG